VAELFDTIEDPREQRDLSAAHPDRVREGLEALNAFESAPMLPGEPIEIPAERIDALRELGYVE
jgi:hypothetical protein